MVFKIGLDYQSYYMLPCEPPSLKAGGCGGCAGCAPPIVPFNQTLAWLKNYSTLVDGLPMTPILVGWQGNGALCSPPRIPSRPGLTPEPCWQQGTTACTLAWTLSMPSLAAALGSTSLWRMRSGSSTRQ